MAIVRMRFDPSKPLSLSDETLRRLDAMSDEELTANALSDPDNPPLTEEEFARIGTVMRTRRALEATGLEPQAFAARFAIPEETLADWLKGRRAADGAALSLLRIIAKRPEVALEAVEPLEAAE